MPNFTLVTGTNGVGKSTFGEKSDEMPNFVNKLIKDTFLEDLLQH